MVILALTYWRPPVLIGLAAARLSAIACPYLCDPTPPLRRLSSMGIALSRAFSALRIRRDEPVSRIFRAPRDPLHRPRQAIPPILISTQRIGDADMKFLIAATVTAGVTAFAAAITAQAGTPVPDASLFVVVAE